MTNLQDAQIAAGIACLVDAELPLLTDHLRSWVEAHRTKPREISVSSDLDRMRFVHVWIVTEDIGERDSSSNVVYDPEPDCFGLVMKLENGVLWYMGPYGSLAETVQAMSPLYVDLTLGSLPRSQLLKSKMPDGSRTDRRGGRHRKHRSDQRPERGEQRPS